MPCSSEDENKVRNIGKICFLAAQAGIRWDEKGKRAYILDARSGGASLIEVPNPIDFQGSYDDFHRMLLTSFSYSDATDLFRKLHTPTLLISNSHIQVAYPLGQCLRKYQKNIGWQLLEQVEMKYLVITIEAESLTLSYLVLHKILMSFQSFLAKVFKMRFI